LTTFQQLSVSNWRQFSNISIELHPRLTILAGANGAGKSTLLRLLAQHFGFEMQMLATPTRSKKGLLRYMTGKFRRGPSKDAQFTDPNWDDIGKLTYSDQETSRILVPNQGAATYSVHFSSASTVAGLFINSHRPVSSYQAIASIPTNAISVQQAYQAYNQEVMNKFNNAYSQFSPIYRIKEAIVSMATFGPGNKNVMGNTQTEKDYEDFKLMLGKVLPSSIGFLDINVRMPDVVLVTKTGDFVVDGASGGLMALIDLAWQLFLFSRDKETFVAIIDEPENHLHPSMQRVIISNLIDAFPKAQFIVATHSPFVVSSVRDSSVYVLRYEDGVETLGPRRTVFSQRLDNYDKAGTASEILQSVLGVPVTLPLWAENELDVIVKDFTIAEMTSTEISRLRANLVEVGLGDYYADALTRIAHQR
jgi:AAA15 family ATPase/GTPase